MFFTYFAIKNILVRTSQNTTEVLLEILTERDFTYVESLFYTEFVSIKQIMCKSIIVCDSFK